MAEVKDVFGRDIDLKVYVYRRAHMRDENLEYEFHIGLNVLRGIFDEMKMMPDVNELFLSFPENWLNILEQRLLFPRLGHYCPNLKKVTIKTQSVYIVQCTPRQNCLIVQHDTELPEECNDKHEPNLTDKMYLPQVGNIMNVHKLNVL